MCEAARGSYRIRRVLLALVLTVAAVLSALPSLNHWAEERWYTSRQDDEHFASGGALHERDYSPWTVTSTEPGKDGDATIRRKHLELQSTWRAVEFNRVSTIFSSGVTVAADAYYYYVAARSGCPSWPDIAFGVTFLAIGVLAWMGMLVWETAFTAEFKETQPDVKRGCVVGCVAQAAVGCLYLALGVGIISLATSERYGWLDRDDRLSLPRPLPAVRPSRGRRRPEPPEAPAAGSSAAASQDEAESKKGDEEAAAPIFASFPPAGLLDEEHGDAVV
mmetsp:Transcript_22235/g.69597  ORF Transcript_22235/g.69597 Transcript_22235/m.69597 type:complete len:277 (-) Transcript_22235:1097-1927(-)